MVQTLTLLFILAATAASGQTRDRRAELNIEGGVKEISVSPDERIWLVTSTGNTYYTEDIDSNWHYGKPIQHKADGLILNNPQLERISFFNKDTAIMTGYISANEKGFSKSGLYYTSDGGESWKLLDFGGDSWIYDAFVDKSGKAWIGGSSGDIYFSQDYGQHWEKLNSPYNSLTRMHSIFMLNASTGISGALHNAIYITHDNWKSSKKIETPFDQKKYPDNDYIQNRIEKIVIWGDFIVVNQQGHIFYTAADKIDWKPFPKKLNKFELGNDTKSLFAITDSLKIISFSSPTEFQFTSDKPLTHLPYDLKVVNHSLYVLTAGKNIYKINKNKITRAIPYTTEEKIAKPPIIKQGKKLTWGANRRQLYLSEDANKDWYRENTFDFEISDIMLLSDSVAILWDGIQDNYLYSLKDRTLKKYFPETPLKTFLLFPIKTFSINSGSQGCFHNTKNEVIYKKENDSTFAVAILFNHYRDKKTSIFKNKVNAFTLANTLSTINANPLSVPSLKDFQITEKDKQNFLTLVDRELKGKESIFVRGRKKINRNFYYSVSAKLDSIDAPIISNILNQREKVWSTTSNWFTIQIVNENNDTINISRNYYLSSHAWHLPWQFEYKGLNFNCYNIEFSKFIKTCMPEDIIGKYFFDNRILIMQIADYLYNKDL